MKMKHSGLVSPPNTINSLSVQSVIHDINNNFNEDRILEFAELLYIDMKYCYQNKSKRSMLKVIAELPKGNDIGRFLNVDVGGSNLKIRVLESVNGNAKVLSEEIWGIKDHIKKIDIRFFEFLCDKIFLVLKRGWFDCSAINTNLTWSFPFHQTSINNGFIDVVSKGYTVSDEVLTKDIKDLFESIMLAKHHILLKINSIVNDAVSVFLTGNYLHYCDIGLVLGTGINISLSVDGNIINTEMSFFGSFILPYINGVIDLGMIPKYYEIAKDNHFYSHYEIYQPMEYLCGGRYLGKMVSIGIAHGIDSGELFEQQNTKKIFEGKGEWDCKRISEISELPYIECRNYFGKHFELDLGIEEYELIQGLIESIVNRASVVLSSILIGCNKFIHDGSTCPTKVACTGSVISKFLLYRDRTVSYLQDHEIELIL